MNKLTEQQKQMVEDNMALATYVAKKYLGKNFIKNQDIIQEARIALMKVIPKYDPTVAKLSTYAYPTIDGHLKMFCNYKDRIIPIPHQNHLKQKTKDAAENAKNIFSLDRKLGSSKSSNSGEEYCLMDIIPDKEDIETDTVNRIYLNEAILSLDWKEKIVITYRYYFDLNQTTVGYLMSMSQVHVHRTEKKALNKMKQYILE